MAALSITGAAPEPSWKSSIGLFLKPLVSDGTSFCHAWPFLRLRREWFPGGFHEIRRLGRLPKSIIHVSGKIVAGLL